MDQVGRMVRMKMGEEDAIDFLMMDPDSQKLSQCPWPEIKENFPASRPQQEAGRAPLDGGNPGSGTYDCDFHDSPQAGFLAKVVTFGYKGNYGTAPEKDRIPISNVQQAGSFFLDTR